MGIVCGTGGQETAVTNPENTVYSIKRSWAVVHRGQRRDEDGPLQVMQIPRAARVKIKDKEYSPPEISALILQKLRKSAEDYWGEGDRCGHHRSAYFNDSQRQPRRTRGHRRLNVRRIINEPRRGLGLRPGQEEGRDHPVYDFGGNVRHLVLEVGTTCGGQIHQRGHHLAGQPGPEIIDWLVAEFKKDQGIDLSKDLMPAAAEGGAEKAKIELSSTWRRRSTSPSSPPMLPAEAHEPQIDRASSNPW